MIYNLSHKHAKGKFGKEKPMDQNPDGIVSKIYHGQANLLVVKQEPLTFHFESKFNLWHINCSSKEYKKDLKIKSFADYHADMDYQSHPPGTVLTFTQE